MLRYKCKGKNVCLKEFTWGPVREKKSGRGRPFFSLPPLKYFIGHTFLIVLVVLLLGCQQEPGVSGTGYEPENKLIGTWTSTAGDSYTITADHLTYTGWNGSIDYAGSIRYTGTFSNTAGVIIIEYDADKKPKYYTSFDPVTFEPVGDPLPLKGNFIGVYYQELTPGVSVKMGGAYIDGGAEEPTLDAAKKAFTLDKEGDYMSYYGTYTK